MPRQNRVMPTGEIRAVPERGTLMGNRGILHDEEGRIKRPWQVRRWLLCLLEFRGRHRVVMTPRRYTELFFLDEATGLAAGHRPCYECQRGRYNAFRDAFARGNPSPLGANGLTAGAIDDRLHDDRVGPARSKRTWRTKLDELPDGAMIADEDRPGETFLVLGDSLFLWSPGGYADRRPRPKGADVEVLTPRSTVNAIQAGFAPGVHASASAR
jgi:hypothetical protein